MKPFLLQHISKTAGDQLFFVAQIDTIVLLDISVKTVKIPVTLCKHCMTSLGIGCTLGVFPAPAFAADKKSSRKIKYKKIPGVH